MTLTHEELKILISEQIDEVTLLDILEVTSDRLVEAFPDEVELKRNVLVGLLEVSGQDESTY